MERGAPRDSTNSKKGGRNFAISKRYKRKTISKIVVLDFLPKEDRPGGHTGEEDPLVGLPSLKLFSFLVFYSRIPVCVIRFRYKIMFFLVCFFHRFLSFIF